MSRLNRETGIYTERRMIHDVCGELLFDHPDYAPMIEKFFKNLSEDANFVIGFGHCYPGGKTTEFCEKKFTDRLVECGKKFGYTIAPQKLKFFYTRTNPESESTGTFKLHPNGHASKLLLEEACKLKPDFDKDRQVYVNP